MISDAGDWSAKAVSLAPRESTLLGTRGAVLVETGRIEEGEAILQDVIAKSADDIDHGHAHFFLALAARARGDHPAAISAARRARILLSPQSIIRVRLDREFPES